MRMEREPLPPVSLASVCACMCMSVHMHVWVHVCVHMHMCVCSVQSNAYYCTLPLCASCYCSWGYKHLREWGVAEKNETKLILRGVLHEEIPM